MPPISVLADYLVSAARDLSQTAEDLRIGLHKEGTAATRMALIQAATALVDFVARPEDKLMVWLPVLAHLTAIRLFIKWGAFEKIPTAEGASTTFRELAAEVEGDQALISKRRRPCIVLAGMCSSSLSVSSRRPDPRGKRYSRVDERRPDHAHGFLQDARGRNAHLGHGAGWVGHPVCRPRIAPVMTDPLARFDNGLTSFSAMPKYFEEHGIDAEPSDRLETILSFAEGSTGSTAWAINHSSPERLKVIMLAMASIDEYLPALGSYDLGWVVREGAQRPDQKLVVDVGAGSGRTLKNILKATPGLDPKRCVLEDLPEVVAVVEERQDKELEGVQLVGMDFFKEQPIKGELNTCLFLNAAESMLTIPL